MGNQVQTPRPRRRLDPFLRKPLWLVLKEECDYSINPTTAPVSVDVDSNSSSSVCATPYDTSSHGGGTNNDATFSMLELPQCKNARDQEEDCAFEHCDITEQSIERTSSTTFPTRNHPTPHPHPPRHLTLFDLVTIGVGGTIGSGIFVLNGLIANTYAGPATFLSWTISGFAALLSGCCYAELSGRIPTAGSSYAYAFVALGELPAFVTACMLTLEFLLSGSAVAR
jgi:hypothetical protein